MKGTTQQHRDEKTKQKTQQRLNLAPRYKSKTGAGRH